MGPIVAGVQCRPACLGGRPLSPFLADLATGPYPPRLPPASPIAPRPCLPAPPPCPPPGSGPQQDHAGAARGLGLPGGHHHRQEVLRHDAGGVGHGVVSALGLRVRAVVRGARRIAAALLAVQMRLVARAPPKRATTAGAQGGCLAALRWPAAAAPAHPVPLPPSCQVRQGQLQPEPRAGQADEGGDPW